MTPEEQAALDAAVEQEKTLMNDDESLEDFFGGELELEEKEEDGSANKKSDDEAEVIEGEDESGGEEGGDKGEEGDSSEDSSSEEEKDVLADLGKEPEEKEEKVEPGKEKRDYSEFTVEEQAVLKRMPNEAFNYTSAKLREHKLLIAETATLKDTAQHIYSNPEAYRILPESKEILANLTDQEDLKGFYQEQLQLASQGKAWTGLKEGADGKLERLPIAATVAKNEDGDEVNVADPQHVAWINQQMGKVDSDKQSLISRYAAIKKEHEEKSKDIPSFLTAAEDKVFPDMKTLTKPQQKFVDEVAKAFPLSLRVDPMMKFVGKGLIHVQALKTQLAAKDAEIAKLKGIKVEKDLAGPGTKAVTSGAGSKEADGDTKEFKDNDFEGMGMPSL
jgi:hypothetical protein